MKKLLILLLIAPPLFANPGVFRSTVTLAWDTPAVAPDHYRLYQGAASGTYTQVTDLPGAVTSTVVAVTPGATFFALTAADAYGDESPLSNEVALPPAPQAPVVTVTPQ